jgi:hypothetical protein
MHHLHITTENLESFEYVQLKLLQFKYSPIHINALPVTEVRHTRKGDFCFISFEVANNCIPYGFQKFVEGKKCDESKKSSIVSYNKDNMYMYGISKVTIRCKRYVYSKYRMLN